MTATATHAPILPAVFAHRSWAHRALSALDTTTMAALLLTVGAMVATVTAQVVLRYGLNLSIDWADEVSRLAFVWSIFLAVPLGCGKAPTSASTSWCRSFPRRCSAACGAWRRPSAP